MRCYHGGIMRLAALLALALWLASPAAAVAQPPAASAPFKLAVTDATLDNGLRVLVQEDSRNPIVAVQILYRVGSRNELPGATGLAHFLEHLMFKGTPKHGRGEISRLIEQNGGRENAFTTKDMTGYFTNIVADRLDLMLQGAPIRLRPDTPNNYNPIYEDDYVELGIRALEAARTPPLVVNWAGSETVSVEDYCTYMGELVGVEPLFEISAEAITPLWPDVTYMHEVLGRTKVHWRDGFRRMVEARHPELVLADGPD